MTTIGRRVTGVVLTMLFCGGVIPPTMALRAEVEAPNNPALECVGALSITHGHTCLVLIGVVADAFGREVYTEETVVELMEGVISDMDADKKALRKLQATDRLSDEDEVYVDRMTSLYNALEAEAKALIKFSKNRTEADAAAFEKARLGALAKFEEIIRSDE